MLFWYACTKIETAMKMSFSLSPLSMRNRTEDTKFSLVQRSALSNRPQRPARWALPLYQSHRYHRCVLVPVMITPPCTTDVLPLPATLGLPVDLNRQVLQLTPLLHLPPFSTVYTVRTAIMRPLTRRTPSCRPQSIWIPFSPHPVSFHTSAVGFEPALPWAGYIIGYTSVTRGRISPDMCVKTLSSFPPFVFSSTHIPSSVARLSSSLHLCSFLRPSLSSFYPLSLPFSIMNG